MPSSMSTTSPPASALYSLLTWTSPAFPVGAYAFSHGLERAVEQGWVDDRHSASDWIDGLVSDGDGLADLVFVSEAWLAGAEPESLADVCEFALAFQSAAEVRTETIAQGRAFLKTANDVWPDTVPAELVAQIGDEAPYPAVFGAVTRRANIDRHDALLAFGHGFVANLVSAAVRLVPLGQTDGQRITAELAGSVSRAALRASATRLNNVSSSCPMSDIACMQHELQYTRLFRS